MSQSIPCRPDDVIDTLKNAGRSEKEARQVWRYLKAKLEEAHGKVAPDTSLYVPLDEYSQLFREACSKVLGKTACQAISAQIPTFVPLQVVGKKGKISPFKRSELALTLEDIGLSGYEAYQIAQQLENDFRSRGHKLIKSSEIDDHAETLLAQRYGAELKAAFFAARHLRGHLTVQSQSDLHGMPFSKTILMQSLLAAGVPAEVARRVAQLTQRHFRTKEDRSIERRQIRAYVDSLLMNEVTHDVRERYQLLRLIRHLSRPVIILIGGMSGTGKSILATEIAYRLRLTHVVGTDSVREVMRAMLSPELVPSLYASTFNAWETILPNDEKPEHPKKNMLLSAFRQQVQQVGVGVSALIERSIKEGSSLVLEGVHLVPGYFSSHFEQAIVVPLVTAVRDEKEHWGHFEQRDAQTDAKRPEARYKKYFAEIRLLQEEILLRAEQRNVTILDCSSIEENVERAIEVILTTILSTLTAEERANILHPHHFHEGALESSSEEPDEASKAESEKGGDNKEQVEQGEGQ